MSTTKGTHMTDTFSKSAAMKRIRALAAVEFGTTKGFKIEVADLNGCTDSLRNLPAEFCKHHAQFRVMKSTTGTWAELRDQFRMSIGDDITPAHEVKGV